MKNLKILHQFSMNVIRNRKNDILNQRKDQIEPELENQKSKLFLKLLIDHHLNNNDLTEEDIREEIDTFMFEGQDTTAMALSWIIFILGHHQNIQAKAAAEVDTLFQDTKELHLNLDQTKQLKYLECCIKEGLRLYPSIPLIGRRLHDDLKIEGYKIPKGTAVYIHIYMLHRDPKVYSNPELFNPDRFLPENQNSSQRNPFSFIPFSAGPRNCIGQRYAMSELKVIIAFLLRRFKFESITSRDKIITRMDMVLRSKHPIKVKISKKILKNTEK